MNHPFTPRLAPLACAATLALSAPAFAFQPLITDDTGTQGTDGNQLEVSYTRDRATSTPDTVTTRASSVTYTRGITDTLDLFVQANRTAVSSSAAGTDNSGAGNPSFGAKWRFYENEDSGLSLGVKPEIRLPVSAAKEAQGLGTGKTSYGATLILTQELPFGAIHANVFTGRDNFRDTAQNPDANTSRISVAPVWDVAEGWKLGLDLGTESRDAGGTSVRTNYWELGIVYSPNKEFDFAIGFPRRNQTISVDPQKTNTTTLGVTWHF